MSRNALYFLAIFTVFSAIGSSASAQGLAARTQPTRSGLFLQGGGWFVGNGAYDNRPWFRVEAGIHLARLNRADLYLQIPAMITHNGVYNNNWFGLAVVPGVRGEWTLFNRRGDLALFLEGGAGFVMFSYSYDDGRSGDSWLRGMLRTGAGVTYTAPFGLMVSAQPFGFGILLGDDSPAFYDGALMIGYRWP